MIFGSTQNECNKRVQIFSKKCLKSKVGTWVSCSAGAWELRLKGSRGSDGDGARGGGNRGSLLLQHRPVEGVVVLVVEGAEEDSEELAQVHVVGAFLEPQPAAVVQVHGELGRVSFAEDLDGRRHLLLADLLILLLLGRCFESLPRQSSTVEVHQDVAKRLHVVSSGLLDAQVRVDAGVTGRARQVLVFPVGNVLTSPVVSKLLGQTVVDKEELVAVTSDAHQEVVWLDVPMDEVLVVDILDSASGNYIIRG